MALEVKQLFHLAVSLNPPLVHQLAKKTSPKILHNPKKEVLIRFRLRMRRRSVKRKTPPKIIQKDLKMILLRRQNKNLLMIVRIQRRTHLINQLNKRSRRCLPPKRHLLRPLRGIGSCWNPSQISRLNHIHLLSRKVIPSFVQRMILHNRRDRGCHSHSWLTHFN